MTSAERYVTAAYLVVLAVVLAYVVIYAFKLSASSARWASSPSSPAGGRRTRAVTEAALLLFWPALAGYAEAAVAYAGDTVRPGRLVRYAIWGVRLGWLAQTALLVAQAASADGFPWGSWAGSLNLFVWMCVGVYLIWGCRAPFRLLGLVVMPLAAVLLLFAWAAGGRRAGAERVRRRLPRRPRRPHPRRVRGLHARSGAVRALPLAGPAPEAADARRPAPALAGARRRSTSSRGARSRSPCRR